MLLCGRAPSLSVEQPLELDPERLGDAKRDLPADGSESTSELQVVDVPRGDPSGLREICYADPGFHPGLPEPGAPSLPLREPFRIRHAYSGITSDSRMQQIRDGLPHAARFLVTGEIDPAELAEVDSVPKRLRWAMNYRKMNQLQLTKRAGLSRAAVNRILMRGESNPRSGIKDQTATKLAKALDFSLHWILTGEGDKFPFEPYLRTDDPMPNRQIAVKAHMLLGSDSRAISQVVNQDWPDDNDPAPKVWFKRIEAAEEQLRGSD